MLRGSNTRRRRRAVPSARLLALCLFLVQITVFIAGNTDTSGSRNSIVYHCSGSCCGVAGSVGVFAYKASVAIINMHSSGCAGSCRRNAISIGKCAVYCYIPNNGPNRVAICCSFMTAFPVRGCTAFSNSSVTIESPFSRISIVLERRMSCGS